MIIDQHPTAATSYTRTLVARGCPQVLASLVGQILAKTDNALEYTNQEKILIRQAYAHLAR